ncbi:uncharacterized protein [Clinocottus analis]|uniref:uncharacterized protein n=1 Tax=Clinocottus analis TaxID=304258 RepID=UPI0035BFB133
MNRRVIVTLTMSAVYLKLVTVLCLSCTALCSRGSSGVEWKEIGEAVTIKCRPPATGQDSLTLLKGLDNEVVFFKTIKQEKYITAEELRDRLQLTGDFPNMDIVIRNLTSNDTGPYWCNYMKFDNETNQYEHVRSRGSVLLVVTDKTPRCDRANNNLILGSVVICVAALSVIIIFFLLWLILKAKMCTAKKPQRVPNSDVYEDMRGTIRC